ncbi:glycoside hydrolase family 15 [Dactylosporangium vinaceum]|uniref:Glycoside hydrolase family 15 protein n=1 Tax=Dactylosporangium vinaceum TaxID=53362 RepID=A0ABV5MJQ0_9ACTN|nr:glycoside hydrolase family 15 protein [Dactylosporangium vinaceum]UAB92670.1 glycoside hydrolase family 15 [Dactylosporangium vinaceum]
MHDLVEHSLKVISREQAPSGAYPACSNFPVYGYAWLRDGAFVADGVLAHGVTDGPRAFHDWTARVIAERAERIDEVVATLAAGAEVAPDSFLPTRYTLDGGDGTESWWDFQLDGYGTWLFVLERFLHSVPADGPSLRPAVRSTVRYLCATWRLPCYDWWEEHSDQVHVSTLTAVEAGLRAALRTGLLDDDLAAQATSAASSIALVVAREGTVDGRLRKWLGSDAVDGSLLAAFAPFGVVDAGTGARTVAAVERDLLDGGGVHRFRADVFYGGGRWPVLAALLGHAYLALDRPADARRQLAWIAGTAAPNGDLPEQVSDRLLAPEHRQEWLDRWGPVATPLLWSHGAFLSLAARLGVTA